MQLKSWKSVLICGSQCWLCRSEGAVQEQLEWGKERLQCMKLAVQVPSPALTLVGLHQSCLCLLAEAGHCKPPPENISSKRY